jgi:RHS repeat-associated protein
LNGSLIKVTDANNHSTRHEYDALTRRIATILPMGQRTTQTYDSVGNLLSTTDFNGTMTRYEYDVLNRLSVKCFNDDTETLYSYTPTGQLQTTTNSLGLTRYSYDAQDRLLSQINPDGRSIGYTYDIVGNRTSIATSNGTTYYSYDPFHRLTQVTDANSSSTQYTYDAVNNLTNTILPNGMTESREYDLRNRLTFIEQRKSNLDVIASYRYNLDAAGNRTAILEHNGRQSTYSYDPLYRLTQEVITDSGLGNLTQSFTYDAIGNRLSHNSSADGLTTYSYDANDRLLQEDRSGAVTTYTYDNNGNTLTHISLVEQVYYQWNSENRLIGVTTTKNGETKETQYRYDPKGARVASIVDGIETRYLVDANLPYAEVLEEYATDGELLTRYVHGLDLISQERGESQSFYLADGLGNIRFLTDLSGQVTDSYTYDAYGNLLGTTGTTENSYRYTGEQFDTNLGEYYLRARYYNPGIGRFTARDPFEGWLTDPLSLAKYPYVHGNPVNLTDPSGLFALDPLTTLVLQGILRAFPSTTFSTALLAARVATPIIVGATAVALLALLDFFSPDDDTDRFNGLPILFFSPGDLPMHWQHIKDAQTGTGTGKSFYTNLRASQPPVYTRPLNSVLNHLGREHPRGWLDQAINIKKDFDKGIIAGALGIPISNIPRSYARDEYPFATTVQGGEANWNMDLVSVRVVGNLESSTQGGLVGAFYNDARVALVAGDPDLSRFGVLTSSTAARKSGYIRRDGSKYFLP